MKKTKTIQLTTVAQVLGVLAKPIPPGYSIATEITIADQEPVFISMMETVPEKPNPPKAFGNRYQVARDIYEKAVEQRLGRKAA